MITSVMPITLQNFCLDRIRGFASAHARLRAPMFTRLFLGVLEITYSQDATTDINAKYVKKAVLRKDMPFGGAKPKFNIYTPFCPKTAILGPDLDGTEIFGQKQL